MKTKYRGGILLSALLFLFLLSFLFLIVLEDFQLTQRFSKKTKDFYTAQIMVDMFLFEAEQKKELKLKGEINFSTGKLHYIFNKNTIEIVVVIGKDTYQFQEKLIKKV